MLFGRQRERSGACGISLLEKRAVVHPYDETGPVGRLVQPLQTISFDAAPVLFGELVHNALELSARFRVRPWFLRRRRAYDEMLRLLGASSDGGFRSKGLRVHATRRAGRIELVRLRNSNGGWMSDDTVVELPGTCEAEVLGGEVLRLLGRVGRSGTSHMDWGAWPQPDWNEPGTVEEVLGRLSRIQDEDDYASVYDAVLYAAGNNHAGSYYPVVVPIVARLGDLLRGESCLARRLVLDVFVDWAMSFGPEAPWSRTLEEELQQSLSALAPRFDAIAREHSATQQERDLASELSEHFRRGGRPDAARGHP